MANDRVSRKPEIYSHYPKFVIDAANAICKELKTSHPEIFQQLYDDWGYPSEAGIQFEDRMKMAVYIEMIKAGIIKS